MEEVEFNEELPDITTDNFEEMYVPEEILPTPKRKKDRRRINKILRQSGKTYCRYNGEICKGKRFNFLPCGCKYDCKKLDLEARKNIFQYFWNLASWDSQTAFICSTAKQVKIDRVIFGIPEQ